MRQLRQELIGTNKVTFGETVKTFFFQQKLQTLDLMVCIIKNITIVNEAFTANSE